MNIFQGHLFVVRDCMILKITISGVIFCIDRIIWKNFYDLPRYHRHIP